MATEQRLSNKREALANELQPGQYLAEHPFRHSEIQIYRQRIFPGKFEVIPIGNYELHPGSTTITRDPDAPAARTHGVSVSHPAPYLALTP